MNKSNSGNISLALYVFAIILLIGGTYHIAKQIITYNWETTTGTILTHSWENNRLPSQPGDFNEAVVSYVYSISGKRYENHKLGYGFNFLSIIKFIEERKFHKYPVASNVKVYFKISAPEQSVLERGISFSVALEIILGLILFHLGGRIGKKT